MESDLDRALRIASSMLPMAVAKALADAVAGERTSLSVVEATAANNARMVEEAWKERDQVKAVLEQIGADVRAVPALRARLEIAEELARDAVQARDAMQLDLTAAREALITEGRARDAAQARAEALAADLARISEEFDLPPTIGPAPGEIRRLREDVARLARERDIAIEDRNGWFDRAAARDKATATHRAYAAKMEEERNAAEAQLAGLARSVRCTVPRVVVEEAGVDGDGSHPSVLLAVQGEDRLGARWRVPMPSLNAARLIASNLYRPTRVEVFILLPEDP